MKIKKLWNKYAEAAQYTIGALFVLVGIFFLWHTTRSPAASYTQNKFDALLVKPQNQVKWKSPGNLEWNSAFDHDGILFGDSIFTGKNSGVEIKQQDLTLKLGSSTLFVVKEQDNHPLLSIDTGHLQITMSEKQKIFTLQVAGEKIDLINKNNENTELSVNYTNQSSELGKNVGLFVRQGNIEITGDNGKKIEIGPNQSIVINKKGNKLKYTKVNFDFKFRSKRHYFLRNEIMPLEWNLDSDRNGVFYFNYSASADMKDSESIAINKSNGSFQNKKLNDKISHFQYDIPFKKLPGHFYIQLKSASKDGVSLFSNIQEMDVIDLPAPTVYDYKITFLNTTDTKIIFNTEDIRFLDFIEVSLFREKDLLNPLWIKQFPHTSFNFLIKDYGRYFLKVRFKLQDISQFSNWSDFIKLDIPQPLKTPKVQITSLNLKDDGVLLTWSEIKDATFYEIVDSTNFNSTKEPQFWQKIIDGHPQIINIIARNDDGRQSRPFKIPVPGFIPAPKFKSYKRLPPPLKRYSINPTGTIELEWLSQKTENQNIVVEISNENITLTTFAGFKRQ